MFYFFIIIFSLVFFRLFYENMRKKDIILMRTPKGGHKLRHKLLFSTVRSFIRALLIGFFSCLLYIIISSFYGLVRDLITIMSDVFTLPDFSIIKKISVDNYHKILNLPEDTFFTSLVIASIFCVYSATSYLLVFILNMCREIRKESEYFEQNELKGSNRFSLDKHISLLMNPSPVDLESFTLKRSFNYKGFIFFENVNQVLAITTLWIVQENSNLHFYVLILSLSIISYSTTLRILSGYFHLLKRRLSTFHKMYFHIISVFIPIASILLGLNYLEDNEKLISYVLIFTTSISFLLLNYGHEINEKRKKDIVNLLDINKSIKYLDSIIKRK